MTNPYEPAPRPGQHPFGNASVPPASASHGAVPNRAVPNPPVPNPMARPGQQPEWQRWQNPAPQQTGAFRQPGSAPSSSTPSYSAPTTQSPTMQSPTARAERPRRRTGAVVGSLVAVALVSGAAGFGGGALAGLQQDGQTQTAPTSSGPTGESVSNPGTIADVAAAAGPSVVTVQAVSQAGSGEGSGVVIADGGYIVTNNHVVTLDGATADATITVETNDGRLLGATIVGTDPVVDLAVIRVDAELPVITMASSDGVRVGDTAVAIGAPLGLSNSVTDGIVSAVDRGLRIASSAAPDAEQDSQQEPFGFWEQDGAQAAQQDVSIPVVQTDASINPGNSGGALLDASGQLIGVNVAIASMGQGGSSGSIGIGFAIEASLVQRVVGEIIAEGAASHGLLGATVSDVRDASVGTVGAQVRELSDGGAAAAAGLQAGDVITAIEGAPVTNAVDATAQVRSHAAGTTVTVAYQRDGQAAEVDVTLGELP